MPTPCSSRSPTGAAWSAEFAELWSRQEVAQLGSRSKTFHHPRVGRLTLAYQTFDVQDAPGQHLLVGTAEPGSPSARRLALLAGPVEGR
ncbi:hypothetical protein [Streptomyces sp. NPDC092952]|uniref:MmyB family transcriptional regulator n=1 Tax=Streptomyces sp. NPDC092952 TaxID=3366018 RepID=UPI0037FCF93E